MTNAGTPPGPSESYLSSLTTSCGALLALPADAPHEPRRTYTVSDDWHLTSVIIETDSPVGSLVRAVPADREYGPWPAGPPRIARRTVGRGRWLRPERHRSFRAPAASQNPGTPPVEGSATPLGTRNQVPPQWRRSARGRQPSNWCERPWGATVVTGGRPVRRCPRVRPWSRAGCQRWCRTWHPRSAAWWATGGWQDVA